MGITCASGLWGGHAFFWEEVSRVNSPMLTQTRRRERRESENAGQHLSRQGGPSSICKKELDRARVNEFAQVTQSCLSQFTASFMKE